MTGDVTHGGSSRPRLAADLIAQRGFMVVRKGYDQDEVRAFLDQVASEVRALHRQIDETPAPAPPAPPAPQPAPAAEREPLDEESIVAFVGEETANVLRAARLAASDLRRRAAAEAERIVDEARQSTGDMRQEAETLLARARQEAGSIAEDIVRAARAEAEQLMAKARVDAEGVKAQAEQERRLTVEGAQAVREKILGDLSRRRRVATVQIEQLRAGRERLLESYAVVRRTLEEVHDELQRADAEARVAADDAGRRAEAELDQERPETPGSSDPSPKPAGPGPGHPDKPADTDVTDASSDATGRPDTDAAPKPGGAAAPGPAPAAAPASTGETSRTPDPGPGPVAWQRGGNRPDAAGPGPGRPATGSSSPAGPVAWSRGSGDTVTVTDDGIERVRVLRSAAPTPAVDTSARDDSGPAGAPVLRSIPGGRLAAGGQPPVELAVDDLAGDDLAGDEAADGDESAAPAEAVAPAEAAAQGETATEALEERTEPSPGSDPEDLEVGSPAGQPTGAVEGLFDRIRTSRQASVDSARQVLEGVPTDQDAPTGVAGPPGAAPDQAAVAAHPAGSLAEAPDQPLKPTGGGAAVAGVEEGLEPLRSDEDEALLQRRDALVGDIEAGLTKKLKRSLQDEQNELLDQLRGVRGTPRAAALLPDQPEHTGRVADAARQLLDQAVRAGMTFAGVEAGDDLAPLSAEVADELAANLVIPLRRRLSEAIRDNAADEQAVLVEAIGAVYRECKTQRVESAVLDAVATAFSKGTYRAVPPTTRLRWVVEDTDGPCPDCDDNALAGLLPRGEPFPTGQLHPPAHAGCRCLLSPEGPA
ncbi:DivIVA domain-containing protein [Acidiferrimicrobium sp. IK]|uniref:DivIVA domain-containing protein n=1 Tax=Acidiferrimicrobium sp. IK TaxID=2871700 RepID=UPI0021CB924B|nr:DivIVA domain-containing protein [Acidiferrimicrobium sp. IK]MCU4185112.1 DivIVA domain-containing protein [Acidiferrimicrobium sp. IK]